LIDWHHAHEKKLENITIANALQLEAAGRRASHSGLPFDQFCTTHAHKLLFRGCLGKNQASLTASTRPLRAKL